MAKKSTQKTPANKPAAIHSKASIAKTPMTSRARKKAPAKRGSKRPPLRPISSSKVVQAFSDLEAVTGAQSTFATERGMGM